ncbi:MAG: ATP-binding cassette domain-containing protein [Treponema sp.]|jgi:methyl-galactoside transport system ATP-binding protein|nr:ATP-binding cassette domain-containing protein [Treponema sp.]
MPSENQPLLLEMTGIDKSFPGVKALDQAQLKLRRGTVHALMGENGAGKSTLMKCLFGIYRKDKGSIRMNGEEVNFTNPRHALDNGVAMVHQELNQILRRNVMENMWLGRLPMKYGFVDHKKMYGDTKKIFTDLEIDVNPREIIGRLSVSKRQLVEIAKAVSSDAKVLVLDEPTSSLTEEEVNHLFRIMKMLVAKNVGIIYISHRMDEIRKISDEVTVMRDGKWVATNVTKDCPVNEIIRLMVNRDMEQFFPPKTNVAGEPLLECTGITGKYMPTCQDVSFTLRKGEILGVAGLVGSRRTELLNTLFGTMTRAGGEIKFKGKVIANRNAGQSMKNGFAMITEERRATGIFPEGNIVFNSIISSIDSYINAGLLRFGRANAAADKVISDLKVKTPSKKTRIKYLSGGNQQKVILGRWLLTNPEVLLLDEPTRGIDVGAKYEIYQLIIDLAKEGKGIIMVSSEMSELLGICDNIIVMSNGRVGGVVKRGVDFGGVDGEQETILRLAARYV